MARTISVSHRSSLDLEETTAALKAVLSSLEERYGIESEWKSERLLTISGPSVIGIVEISAINEVTISVSLGAMLSPFAMLIENHIREEFIKQLD